MTVDIEKWTWWPVVNERRALLISKKISGKLTQNEFAEFTVLQGIAEVIVTGTTGPFKINPRLEALTKRFEKLAAKVQRKLDRFSESSK